MTDQFTSPDQYQSLLEQKIQKVKALFSAYNMPEMDVFESPKQHYRMRTEFKIWHEGTETYFAMHQPGEKSKPFKVETFSVANELINRAMPLLITHITPNELLKRKLFQCEFLSTLTDELLITLIYHKPLNEEWIEQAKQLKAELSNLLNCQVDIIGRSRKQKIVLDRDFVFETLTVNERKFTYQQLEGGFTQPNAQVCEKMLTWAVDATCNNSGDLLELYCGNGNFTLPLSQNFNRVLATEIAKSSVQAAHKNIEMNQVDNIEIARLSSEELVQALNGVREFRRLREIDLQKFEFSTVFVDPPRAGLDPATVEFVAKFDEILYISCNPTTLEQNLASLSKTHTATQFALFDQFPYTDHIECGVKLVRK